MRYIDQMNMPTALCDFNATTDGGFIPFASSDVTGLLPKVGDWLTLQDEDGNTCLAVVSQVAGSLLYGCALWETWQTSVASERFSRPVPSYPRSPVSEATTSGASDVLHNDFATSVHG